MHPSFIVTKILTKCLAKIANWSAFLCSYQFIGSYEKRISSLGSVWMTYDAGTSKKTMPIIIKISAPQNHEIPTWVETRVLKREKGWDLWTWSAIDIPLRHNLSRCWWKAWHTDNHLSRAPIKTRPKWWVVHTLERWESRKLPRQLRHRSISLKVLALWSSSHPHLWKLLTFNERFHWKIFPPLIMSFSRYCFQSGHLRSGGVWCWFCQHMESGSTAEKEG